MSDPRSEGAGEAGGLDLEAIRIALSRAVLANCPRWLGAEREDIVQAAMLRVLSLHKDRENNPVRTSSYLWKVAYSVTVDEIRRRRRSREVALDDAAVAEPAGPDTPESRAADAERGRAVRDCLRRLAEGRRLAVMLHLQGHALDEGSTILGLGRKRYENLVYRGLQDLRRCLVGRGIER